MELVRRVCHACLEARQLPVEPALLPPAEARPRGQAKPALRLPMPAPGLAAKEGSLASKGLPTSPGDSTAAPSEREACQAWDVASNSSTSTATEAGCLQSLGALVSDTEGEPTPRLRSLSLCEGLFFYEEPALGAEGEPLVAIAAEHVEVYGVDGPLRVVGHRRGEALRVAKAAVGGLRLETRLAPEDDSCLVRLCGAWLPAGRVSCIGLSPCGDSLVCEVVRSGLTVQLPLEQAVAELREVQVRRRNAELEVYQRQLCSMMMGAQRRRLLGMSSQ